MWHPDTRGVVDLSNQEKQQLPVHFSNRAHTNTSLRARTQPINLAGATQENPARVICPIPFSLCWFPWRACAWMEINKIERIDSPCRCARRPPNKCVFPFRKITKTNGLRISDGSERPPVTQRRPSKNERLSEMQMRHLCVCVCESWLDPRATITHTLYLYGDPGGRAHKLCIFLRDTCAPINIYPHLVEYIKIGRLKYISMLSSGYDALCPDNALPIFDERHPVRGDMAAGRGVIIRRAPRAQNNSL
jgi:hypothetical protein